MVDFINEVEEELRKDKYNQLLRKFGPYIVGAIIIIVAGTGFVEYRKYSKEKIAKAASASYMSASMLEQEGKLDEATNKFIALSELAPNGYAGLSLSRAAGIQLRLGEYNKAIALLDKASEHFETPLHKDLAQLKVLYILMDQGRYDDVIARAGNLMYDEGPYRDLAREIAAQASLQAGDEKLARKEFTYLANTPGVQRGVKARAGQALALLKAKTPEITDAKSDNKTDIGAEPSKDEQDKQD